MPTEEQHLADILAHVQDIWDWMRPLHEMIEKVQADLDHVKAEIQALKDERSPPA